MVIENIKDIENKHNLSHYEALQRFMFERISLSNYQDNFILKGLKSLMYGLPLEILGNFEIITKLCKENLFLVSLYL